MENTLLDISTAELLNKFGAGKHKPGSGSAAAFQAMLSAKLLTTVISLTDMPKRRKNYSKCLPTLLEHSLRLDTIIFPELCSLFNEDASEFDKAILLRNSRDTEVDPLAKNQFRRQAVEQMKTSISIPLKICAFAIEICEISNYVFDNAFKSARGDSHVALSCAVSSLSGCISIIRLNLLQFRSDDFRYCEGVLKRLRQLDIDYSNYNSLAKSKMVELQMEFDAQIPFYKDLNDLTDRLKSIINPSVEQVEEGIKSLQNLIWSYREIIWKKNPPHHPLEILDPEKILRDVFAYDYVTKDAFGVKIENGVTKEIAGLIDQPNRLVVISNKFNPQVQRFTAAHELSHAVFHKYDVQHRDIPTDGSSYSSYRSAEEKVADKGASYFLMPAKILTLSFVEKFGTQRFIIDEQTSLNLTRGVPSAVRREFKSARELARKLASTEFYQYRAFSSLAKEFNVSIETMAIRLEQLKLLEY